MYEWVVVGGYVPTTTMVALQVQLQHSDLAGRVSTLKKIPHAIIDAFHESGIPTISIDAKPRVIRIPICKPLSLYPKRIATHGELGFTLHKFKSNPWDKSFKVLQVHITTENKEALERLCESIVQALRGGGGGAVGGRALQSSSLANSASPVRRVKIADAYSNRRQILVEDLPPLSQEQQQVFDLVVNGKKSLFFTGSAGTGKSLLLKHIVKALPVSSTAVTGTTGLSGSLLGGSTIHAFAGIGRGDGDVDLMLRYASRPDTAFRWRNTRTLIIDEISMMDGTFFDVLELVARKIRRDSRPFGGIQLVVCGDYHQLPPVTRHSSQRSFCFESRSWSSCIHHCIELKQVFRQSDLYFVQVLGEVRKGILSHVDLMEKLHMCCRPLNVGDGILPTKIYTHRVDVESINTKELDALPGTPCVYHARDSGDPSILESTCPAPKTIHLKVGAQVMLTRNISSSKGLVNGSRGVVVKISSTGLPYVRFVSQSDQDILVEREKWSMSLGGRVVASRVQMPLSLAYAITVHKSQGMSLDKVEISLERAFEAGMAYVALSRAKTMEGLRICGTVAQQSLEADPKVIQFYTCTQFL